MPTAERVVFEREPSPASLRAHFASLVRALPGVAREAAPFLLLTPIGVRGAHTLAAQLQELGIVVEHRRPLPTWPMLGSLLRAQRLDGLGQRRAWMFEALWSRLYPGAHAECWRLGGKDYQRLLGMKPQLRQRTLSRRIRVETPSFGFQSRLHAFHLPDEPDLAEEWRAVQTADKLCLPQRSGLSCSRRWHTSSGV